MVRGRLSFNPLPEPRVTKIHEFKYNMLPVRACVYSKFMQVVYDNL